MVNQINFMWGSLFLLSFRVGSAAFQTPSSHRPRVPLTASSSTSYGRGAEIWPQCNEKPVLLEDSFPDGFIPNIAQDELQTSRKYEPEVVETPKRRRRVPRAIQRILRRAAVKEEDVEYNHMSVDMTPAVIAVSLLVGGLVQPVDVLVVAFLSGYLLILGSVARSMRTDGVTPILPSLPPQGHVPALVSNPLGNAFTNSDGYDLWLKFGTAVSVMAPIALLGRYLWSQNDQVELSKFCARPVFLLCCQAVSESISRRVMAPLPIRILVPIAYNTVRLVPLWSWALTPTPLGYVGRLVAVMNLIYWACNLFGFLLPTAAMRYMRAHFFNVEAEQIITRPGFDSTIGLLP